MKPDTLSDRFGSAGRRAWELAQGKEDAPLIPVRNEESVVERATLPLTSASMDLLLAAVDALLWRAYSRPQMRGRYADGAALECVLPESNQPVLCCR